MRINEHTKNNTKQSIKRNREKGKRKLKQNQLDKKKSKLNNVEYMVKISFTKHDVKCLSNGLHEQ